MCISSTISHGVVRLPSLRRSPVTAGGEESLEEISWEEFSDKYDEKNLAFLYQEKRNSS